MPQEKLPNEGYRFKPEKDLPILCNELYNDNWVIFYKDLKERLKRRPAVYRITERIKPDIKYIKDNYLSKLSKQELKRQLSEVIDGFSESANMEQIKEENPDLVEIIELLQKKKK